DGTSLEGTVVHRAECTPVANDNYMKLKNLVAHGIAIATASQWQMRRHDENKRQRRELAACRHRKRFSDGSNSVTFP
ncbi:unnamed protein product, partial [Tetraodon nigroviridis]